MGSNDGDEEKAPRRIYLDGYWMGKYEVTVEQFRVFVKTKSYKTQTETETRGYLIAGDEWGGKLNHDWKNPGFKQEDNHPVVYVSWNDAAAYCKWLSVKKGLNFKLPTDDQWEKAARGIKGRKYPWGDHEPYYKGKWYANRE